MDAGNMDRKYFYAFVKGLTNIKYKEAFLRSKKDFDLDESMDLQFLYANLFNDQETSLSQFNKLVESCLQVIEVIVQNNMTKDQLEEFLSNQVQAKEDHKKQIATFWKNDCTKIITALTEPLRNETSGIAEMDWEIQLTTASRHQASINKQSATVLIQPKRGNARDKIMFEIEKKDARLILDKLASLEKVLEA